MKELFRVVTDEQGQILFDCNGEDFELSSDQIGALRELIFGPPTLIDEAQQTHKRGTFTIKLTTTKTVHEFYLGDSWQKVLDVLDEEERLLKDSGG